jgi:hypothetical protein
MLNSDARQCWLDFNILIAGVHCATMKRQERDKQLDGIFDRLDQINVEDREIIKPTSANNPVTITEAQLKAYGERGKERTVLYEKLRALAGEPIEED